MATPRAYIGTSGWTYPDWKLRFYPREVRPADWLAYFSRHFETTEVNNSFYRMPRQDVVERWSNQVPPGFRFAVKLWRGITQYKKLRNCRESLQLFFDAVDVLPARQRGPLLVQLPPNLKRDLPRLADFLNEVHEVTADSAWRIAVEFRHNDWLCNDTYQLLDRHRAAICLHDLPDRGAATEPNDAPFVYVRRHGKTGKYRGNYPDEDLAADADRIRAWLARKKTVFVYFNNDLEGHAVANARQLNALVGAELATGGERCGRSLL